MSDDPSKLPDTPPLPEAAASLPRRRRTLRRMMLLAGFVFFLLAAVVVGLFFWASSDSFESLVRKRIVDVLQVSTGGRVEIASFHWHLLSLEAEAGGIVLHGTEVPGEAPYATIDRLRASITILGFF